MQEAQELLASLSRRSFLLGTGSLLAALAAPPSLWAAAAVDRHEIIWRQLMTTVLPVERPDFVFDADKVLAKLELILAAFPAESQDVLNLVLPVFDQAARVIHWNGRPFHKLERKAAVRYCQSWEQGFLFQVRIVKALKSMIYTSYWSLPETWAAVGYQGPVSGRMEIPSLGPAPLPSIKGARG